VQWAAQVEAATSSGPGDRYYHRGWHRRCRDSCDAGGNAWGRQVGGRRGGVVDSKWSGGASPWRTHI